MPIHQHTSDWKEWLAAQRAASQMTATVIPLSEAQPWGMQDNGARFGRPDGSFFNLVGAHVVAQREVREWNQPLLRETGEGIVVLVITKAAPALFLIAARQEPGNTTKPGNVLLGPTLQTSLSNLQQTHGGKRPPRAELLDGQEDIKWVEMTMDGGRFIGKVNRYAVVEVDEERIARDGDGREIARTGNERWFDPYELREALLAGDVNEHLAIALLVALDAR